MPRGFLVHGSNGEFCYLSTEERVAVIRAVREAAGSHLLVLAGSGCESTRETITMTKAMAEAGADVAVVITPCYFKVHLHLFSHPALLLPVPLPCMLLTLPLPSFLCDQGKMTGPVLEQHYTAVADASPIPVVLYRCGVAAGSRLL